MPAYKEGINGFTYDLATGEWTGVIGQQGQVQYLPKIVAQTAIPIVLAPNGTIATNGTVTLGTALPGIFKDAWCFFPANAVSGDTTGGLYYCKFTSTTVGTVYAGKVGNATGASVAFVPTDPDAVVTPVVVTGSNSAYTQTTGSAITLLNVPITGGLMGFSGAIRISAICSNNNSAGNKILSQQLSSFVFYTQTVTTTTVINNTNYVRNRGDQTVQLGYTSAGLGAGTGGIVYGTIDTTATQALTITAQIATATDYLLLEGFTIEVMPN
jgi:hypothetical protein